jgi:hypothetical protein
MEFVPIVAVFVDGIKPENIFCCFFCRKIAIFGEWCKLFNASGIK